MKFLILSDLHMDYYSQPVITEKKENIIKNLENSFYCILLCGDNAEVCFNFTNHLNLFETLRKKFSCPIGFVVGNHDLWTKDMLSSKKALYEKFDKIAKNTGLIYLEKENISIGEFTIVGTYGHYDYSLGNMLRGITRKNFEIGEVIIGNKKIIWNDKKLMDWENNSDREICNKLLEEFECRLVQSDKKLITISHVVPNKNLSGYKDSIEQDFLGAFSGTKRLEEIIRKYPILYHFCGHTHAYAKRKIGNTQAINIGADYKLYRHVLLDTETGKIENYIKQL